MREGKRLFVFDLLRGVAVFLMILAHCVYFFYDRSGSFLVAIENFGNTFCYSLFLFIAGAVMALAYLQKGRLDTESKSRLRKRIIVFVVAYYLLALFVQVSSIVGASGLEKLKIVFDILSLRLLPSYTEYIPPFAIYSIIVLLYSAYIKKIISKPFNILFLAAVLYLFGHLTYSINVPEFLVPWKAFLAGHSGYYRFPIFQYCSVFLVGAWWGNIAISNKIYSQKKDLSLNIFATILLILLLVLIAGRFSFANYQTIFLRWPPSVSFILLGLSFCFCLIYLFYRYNMLVKIKLLRDFLLLLGQNAFSLLWAHIVFLQLYNMSGGAKTDSLSIFFYLYLITLAFSLAIATFVPFNFRFGLVFFKNSLEEEEDLIEKEMLFKFGGDLYQTLRDDFGKIKNFFLPEKTGLRDKRVIKKRHFIGISLIVLFVLNALTPVAKEEIKAKILSNKPTWWSEDYGFRKPIFIENTESLSSLKKGETIKIIFDQQKLLDQNKVLFDGSDIKVVYWDGKRYNYPAFTFSNLNEPSKAELNFALVDEIGPNKTSSNYYIYYGNPIDEKADFSAVKLSLDNQTHEYKASFKNEESHQFLLMPKKKWNLIDDNNSKKVTLSFRSDEKLNEPKITYNILGKNISGDFSFAGNGEWIADIPLTSLSPGKYSVQAKVSDGENEYLSQKSGFYVSYPLYFSWTLDWEGYDASSEYLKNINRVADDYLLPITHYFCPRIYLPEFDKSRSAYLTDWLKKRLEKNDSLGLHIHMFNDFVSAAGVTPKNDLNWGDNGDGYGSLTTNYTEEEMDKILTYSKTLFSQNNLETPIYYRAGGWFANVTTLKSLAKNGFLADSSGRVEYEFGKNKQKGFWNLEFNSLPYYPSLIDQNRNADEENRIGIMEIPNNGADTYWYSSFELINIFKQNYYGGFLNSNRTVTFLSHPQWYNEKEMKKTLEYLSFVNQYNSEKDYGPIIYSDVNEIYNVFKD